MLHPRIIRSLAYFSPVIEEVMSLPVSPEYFAICAIASQPYISQVASISVTAFTPAAWMIVELVCYLDLQPTCAPTARMIN